VRGGDGALIDADLGDAVRQARLGDQKHSYTNLDALHAGVAISVVCFAA
jgi:hypothetical protein